MIVSQYVTTEHKKSDRGFFLPAHFHQYANPEVIANPANYATFTPSNPGRPGMGGF